MESARNRLSIHNVIYTSVVSLLLTLAALIMPATAAEPVNRASMLQEIIALKAQVESAADPTEKKRLTDLLNQKELLFLASADADREAFSSLLKQPNTGVCRLMPRENFDGLLLMRGGGSYYSFVRQENPYGFGSDLGLEQERLKVGFNGANYGFLTRLGDLPLEGVTRETPGVAWLSSFAPPLDEPGARQQQTRTSQGFSENNFSYKDRLPIETSVTYALRSVIYHESDVLVVFRTYRRDTDKSVILAWKVLTRFVTPQLNGSGLATVSAANYQPSNFAKDMIAAAFGNGFATGTFVATSLPLPLQLGGAYVSIEDSVSTPRYAPLFAVTPNQINYLIPPETAEGYALVTVRAASGQSYRELIRVAKTAPGLFSANADGQGVAAALVLRIRDGQQIYEPVARFDQAQGKFVSIPIDLSANGDQVYLLLYGVGIRGRSSLQNVSVKVGGIELAPSYAGMQGQFGLDQVNVTLSSDLAGLGEVDVSLTVDGQAANTVRINFK